VSDYIRQIVTGLVVENCGLSNRQYETQRKLGFLLAKEKYGEQVAVTP